MNLARRFALLPFSLATAVGVSAQTTISDFSSTAGWGTSTQLSGTSGAAVSISGGVANYTATSPNGTTSDFAILPSTAVVGSYSNDWAVQVQVNYANPDSIFSGPTPQFINLGLLAVKTGALPGMSAGSHDSFEVASNLYWDGSAASRDIRISTFGPGGNVDDTTRYATGPATTASTATLRLSYTAATHLLTGSFGPTFSPITSLTVDASTPPWSMTNSDTFSIYLYGNSGYDGGASGFGPVLTTGAATFDNFAGTNLTAVPEPSTYAAIAGAVVLGLAIWRRRQRRPLAA